MVPETPNSNLLPVRHPQPDLFICDVADAILKDVTQQMEHPFYSLSKKPVTSVNRYEHGEHWLEITPSVKGLATIYDKDILIFAISQIMAKLNDGQPVSPRVRINTRDFLIFCNRDTGGKDYKAFNTSGKRSGWPLAVGRGHPIRLGVPCDSRGRGSDSQPRLLPSWKAVRAPCL